MLLMKKAIIKVWTVAENLRVIPFLKLQDIHAAIKKADNLYLLIKKSVCFQSTVTVLTSFTENKNTSR